MILNQLGSNGIKVKKVVTHPDYIQVKVVAEYENLKHTTVTITCDATRKKTTVYSVSVKYGNGLMGNPYFTITFLPDGKYIVSPYDDANTNIVSYTVTAYDEKTGNITIDVTSSTNWNPNHSSIYEEYVVVAYEM